MPTDDREAQLRDKLLVMGVLAVLLGLSGCAPLPRYQPPVGGEVALIKLIDKGTPTRATFSASASCGERRAFPTWSWVDVPAGRRVYFDHGVSGTNFDCSIRFSFVPEKDESYEVDYERPALTCKVTVRRLGKQHVQERLPVDSVERESSCLW